MYAFTVILKSGAEKSCLSDNPLLHICKDWENYLEQTFENGDNDLLKVEGFVDNAKKEVVFIQVLMNEIAGIITGAY